MKIKKIAAILIFSILIILTFSFSISAVETSAPMVEETSPIMEDNQHTDTPIPVEDEKTEHTFFSRVWEYIVNNRDEVLEISGTAILFILTVFIKLKSDKATRSIALDVIESKRTVDDTLFGQNAVIDRVNNMIDTNNKLSSSYIELKETYDKYGQTEDDRNKVNGAILVTNTAILEILTTVYANSKNLPQGIKDIINLKYANCLKALNDEQYLISLVNTVRNNINNLNSKNISETNTSENSRV